MAVLRLSGDISGHCDIQAANTASSVTVTTPTLSGNLISIPTGSVISNGKTLIGNTSTGGFDVATLTGGTEITVTNLGGSITINATGLGATDSYARSHSNGAFDKANSIATNLGSLNLSPAFAQISSNVSQLPANTSAVVVNYDTNDALLETTHDAGNTRVIVTSNGLYHFMFSGRVSRGVGETQERADYWFRKNGTDIANSSVSITLEASDTATIINKYAAQLVANDYLEVVQAISNASISMGLTRADPLVGGAPSNPAITFTIIKVLSAQSAPAFGTATINFGSAPGSTSANVAVTGQTQLPANAHIQVYIQGNDQTADHTAFEHGFIRGYLNPFVQNVVGGAGFTIEAHSEIRLTGELVLRWRYN
jgi:hypothetical protein